MNDREFVARLRQQDVGAIRYLSECLLPSVWRFVYFRVKGDQHLAEDIVSDTALALIKFVAEPENHLECPTTWMRGVANHKIQDHFRAVARVQHLIDQASSHTDRKEAIAPHQLEETNERRAAVRRVMDDLSESHRLVLEWKYIDRISVRQIAERMGLTEKAVEAMLYRARREFRDGLGVLHRDDVPFRLNGSTNQVAQVESEGLHPVNRRGDGDVSIPKDAQQSACIDEQKQR